MAVAMGVFAIELLISGVSARADRIQAGLDRSFEFPVAESELPDDGNDVLIANLLVDSVVMVESGGNPSMVGRHGERGLMQIKSGTWRDMTKSMFGSPIAFNRAFESELNRRVGKAYLHYLQRFLDQHRAEWQADERSLLLACYNAGPARVAQAGFRLDRIPRDARDYVQRVSALHDDLLAEHRIQLVPADGNRLVVASGARLQADS